MRPDEAPVDAIVVNFHSGRVLPRCVAALRRFLPEDARYILVDNSPGDGAVEAVVPELPHVTVLPQERNVGFAAAVNRCSAG